MVSLERENVSVVGSKDGKGGMRKRGRAGEWACPSRAGSRKCLVDGKIVGVCKVEEVEELGRWKRAWSWVKL